MDKNELCDFEDSNYEKLVEEFIRRYLGLWEKFVVEEYAQEQYRAEARAESDR